MIEASPEESVFVSDPKIFDRASAVKEAEEIVKYLGPRLNGGNFSDWKNAWKVGYAYYVLGNCHKAAQIFRNVLSVHEEPRLWMNLGIALLEDGRHEQAFKCFSTAYKQDSYSDEIVHAYATALLRHGDWENGFRLFNKAFIEPTWRGLDAGVPRWIGQDLKGKTIGVLSEAGLGDHVQFMRYIKILTEMEAKVILHCPRPLVPLFSGHPWGFEIKEAFGDVDVSDLDYWTTIFSLPAYFEKDPRSVYCPVPYLKADDELVCAMRPWIPKEGFTIGICWQAAEGADPLPYRSLPWGHVEKIVKNSSPRFNWVNLQYGVKRDLITHNPPINNCADVAAIIELTDLVISADTNVLHIAGALNKKTWTPIPGRGGDWRWGLKGNEPVWYPSLRLFRNGSQGFDKAVSNIIESLSHIGDGGF